MQDRKPVREHSRGGIAVHEDLVAHVDAVAPEEGLCIADHSEQLEIDPLEGPRTDQQSILIQ